MENFNNIAADIFKRYGLGIETAERAGGWTNTVWLNGDVVLRLSTTEGNDRIRREVERSMLLPSAVGYPENIATGVQDGFEWSLSKRVPGQCLSEVWGDLSWTDKATAVKQIFEIMQAVHTVDVEKAGQITLKRAWYSAFDRDETFSEFEGYAARGIFSAEQSKELREILERFYAALDKADFVLTHGDITTDNLLWHDGKVISLLDFEWAAIAPRQLDLHSVVNLALVSYDEEQGRDLILFEDEGEEVQGYVKEMVSLFRPLLESQRDWDLFLGYNVLFRQRFFEFWLGKPEGEIDSCDAYRKLQVLSNGSGGYLTPLLSIVN